MENSKYKKQFGSSGEDIALNYLQQKGFTVVERNFTIWGGEIDLIMKDVDEYVFVEVKNRVDNTVPIEELISETKQKTLIRTAELWLNKNKIEDVDWRFDVVGITKDQDENIISWIKNAFY